MADGRFHTRSPAMPMSIIIKQFIVFVFHRSLTWWRGQKASLLNFQHQALNDGREG
jgi:hypothetical protein